MKNQSNRFMATAVLVVLAFVLAVVAINQPVVTENIGSTNLISISLFQTCNKSVVQGVDSNICKKDNLQFGCSALTGRFRAARAFSIISCLVLGAAAIVSILRAVKHFALTSSMHKSFFIMVIAGCFVSLITFPIIISIYTTPYCDVPAYVTIDEIGLGSSGEFMGVAFGSILLALLTELAMRPTSNEMQQLEASEGKLNLDGFDSGDDNNNNNSAKEKEYGAV